MTLVTLVYAVIGILLVLIVGGVLAWIVRSAPFVPDAMKQAVTWFIWVVIALIFLLWLVQSLNGAGPHRLW